MKVEVKILRSQIKDYLPSYASKSAAALDLRACIKEAMVLKGGATLLVPTGIALYMKDSETAALILPRSGLGHRHGLVLGNGVGLIDADYQGELQVSLWNRSDAPYTIKPLERIAQLLYIPIKRLEFSLVDDFIASERGEGGFGSTGCTDD